MKHLKSVIAVITVALTGAQAWSLDVHQFIVYQAKLAEDAGLPSQAFADLARTIKNSTEYGFVPSVEIVSVNPSAGVYHLMDGRPASVQETVTTKVLFPNNPEIVNRELEMVYAIKRVVQRYPNVKTVALRLIRISEMLELPPLARSANVALQTQFLQETAKTFTYVQSAGGGGITCASLF